MNYLEYNELDTKTREAIAGAGHGYSTLRLEVSNPTVKSLILDLKGLLNAEIEDVNYNNAKLIVTALDTINIYLKDNNYNANYPFKKEHTETELYLTKSYISIMRSYNIRVLQSYVCKEVEVFKQYIHRNADIFNCILIIPNSYIKDPRGKNNIIAIEDSILKQCMKYQHQYNEWINESEMTIAEVKTYIKNGGT